MNGVFDIAVVGAGAAGLMASIQAGRAGMNRKGGKGGKIGQGGGCKVVAIDGADRLGAKILVSGGGRCNVTHRRVSENDYAGGSGNAVRNSLRRFGVSDTVRFFRELNVELKQEENGKLFPVTDRARTVLDALLSAARDAEVELHHPARVDAVEALDLGFAIHGKTGTINARCAIIATGGKALAKSGSDGSGYSIARSLGHTTSRVFPALVPLVLDRDCPLRELAGLTLPARIELRSSTSRRIISFTGSTLCTHFGLSGPAVMDISRHYLAARNTDAGAHLVISFLPDNSRADLEAELLNLGQRRTLAWVRGRLPDRLAGALCAHAGVLPDSTGSTLRKETRRSLLDAMLEYRLPVVGDRGFAHAEVTAGGVPLDEIDIKTMGSRRCPGLYFCGEILDVDGRIGGFNFQWAWTSGYIAGTSAAAFIGQGAGGHQAQV